MSEIIEKLKLFEEVKAQLMKLSGAGEGQPLDDHNLEFAYRFAFNGSDDATNWAIAKLNGEYKAAKVEEIYYQR